MAEEEEGNKRRKSRSPYKKYVRHFNPYKFKTVRRVKKRQDSTRDSPQGGFILSDTSIDELELPALATSTCCTSDSNSEMHTESTTGVALGLPETLEEAKIMTYTFTTIPSTRMRMGIRTVKRRQSI